jgi:hypothetical protein
MTEFQFQNRFPDGWDDLCNQHDALFGTAAWQSFLESSFGCRTIYGTNGEQGVAITVFKAGPFEVGYLGFPAGITIGHAVDLRALLSDFKESNLPGKPVCIRLSPSAFSQAAELKLKYVVNSETAITDLQSWDAMGVSSKLRRAIRKTEKSGLVPFEITDIALHEAIFDMYRRTVQRNRGSLRYSREYFKGFIRLSVETTEVRITGVLVDDLLAGFVATCRDNGTTYYLHGGTASDFRHLSPSDILMRDAIEFARSAGSQCFNFMASPLKQPELVRYKEKWGATTRQI